MKQHIIDTIQLDRIECEGGGIVSQRAYINGIPVGLLWGNNGTQPEAEAGMQGPEDLDEEKVLQAYKQGLLDSGLSEYEASKAVACLKYDLVERPQEPIPIRQKRPKGSLKRKI